jgi:hypothetical protein
LFLQLNPVAHGSNEAGLPATANAAGGAASPTQPVQQISKSKWRLFGWAVTIPALIAGIFWIYSYTRRTVFALAPRDTIVLADFENTTGEQIFNDTLRQGLMVGLAESPIVHVLSDRNSAVIFRQMGHSPDDRMTGRVAIDLCWRVAEIGDSRLALATCEILDKQYPNGTFIQNYWLPSIRAKVELQRGNAAKAISLLSVTPPFDAAVPDEFATSPFYPAYVRGQAYLAAGDGRKAGDEFKAIIDRPGMVLNLPLGALARLGQARAYVLSGRTADARDAYQSFFKLWSDADPDIPLLRQAHAEFDRLKPTA